jgi:hypothetical protein
MKKEMEGTGLQTLLVHYLLFLVIYIILNYFCMLTGSFVETETTLADNNETAASSCSAG